MVSKNLAAQLDCGIVNVVREKATETAGIWSVRNRTGVQCENTIRALSPSVKGLGGGVPRKHLPKESIATQPTRPPKQLRRGNLKENAHGEREKAAINGGGDYEPTGQSKQRGGGKGGDQKDRDDRIAKGHEDGDPIEQINAAKKENLAKRGRSRWAHR